MRICDDLRQAVLQAAIQGKLTKQLPEDGNAKDLLKQIAAEKAELIREGKIKKEKPLPEITPEEVPFDIPENWKWVRLLNICIGIGDGLHGTPKFDKDSHFIFVNGSNLLQGRIVSTPGTKYVNYYEYEKYKINLSLNAILLSINGTIGNLAYYNNEKIVLGKSACFIDLIDLVPKEYINLVLQTEYFIDYSSTKATKTTINNLGLKAIRNCPIPLPPLAEQQRIVARVEELMARIDDLEKTETELEKLKAAFPGDMKAALLQAAMQGKLTEQLPEDGDAADLLEQIVKEKSQLIKEGKIKKEKPLPKITPDEVPFDIPENWK